MNTTVITIDIVRKAIHGAAIANNGELFAQHDGKIPSEFIRCAKIIQDNYEQFQQLVWKRLENLQYTKKYFGKLIRARLKQKGILVSPIISVIFDDFQTLEKRLNNVSSISGMELLRNEYRGSKDSLHGDITDAIMRNMLAEVHVLDFLIQSGFVNIRKISRKDKAHIDIFAEKDGLSYAIDVTRKQEVTYWKIKSETNLEDCNSRENQLKIRHLIKQELANKDEQFRRSLDANTISDLTVKVVAVKTSDYGFAECIEQVSRITEELLSEEGQWQYLDAVWLLPNVDVKQSRWVYKI